MYNFDNLIKEKYIKFTSFYQDDYEKNMKYELDLCIPYSLISDLIGFECTEETAKSFPFSDDLAIDSIFGRDLGIIIDLKCYRLVSVPSFRINHHELFHYFIDDFIDSIDVDYSIYDTEEELAAYLSEKYGVALELSLMHTLKLIIFKFTNYYENTIQYR
jgi:hypothetical protein